MKPSETLPLNEWLSDDLKSLLIILQSFEGRDIDLVNSNEAFKSVVKQAIRDAEQEEERQFEAWSESKYLGDGKFADNH